MIVIYELHKPAILHHDLHDLVNVTSLLIIILIKEYASLVGETGASSIFFLYDFFLYNEVRKLIFLSGSIQL